jgi:hypothetical protein
MTAKTIAVVYHADHGIERSTLDTLVATLDPTGFFLVTVNLPEGCPDVQNALHGPKCGDAPVLDAEVTMKQRSPDRPMSRMVARPTRPTRLVTLIGIEKDGAVTLFTAHGGPSAEREPGDKSMEGDAAAIEASAKFWAEHALSL